MFVILSQLTLEDDHPSTAAANEVDEEDSDGKDDDDVWCDAQA